ncbi:hypothetical protein ORV05_05080 [Amycolatopsis cynarae]|uniref:Uncharacterized protein n=1 Tax=Amycolatopsis cynarae TaxID=2995223 RepID=A0ABY7B4A6_9PSEU|nr:hypothetical protein [Amycolatopsis sp. HUAS 11-8]WAL67166.1 hypothetical protein ORV05_05080 [Amycolatopsis sp. HUAS 11-8]
MNESSEQILAGYQLMKMVADVNENLGNVVVRVLEYEIEHGHLPPDELREMGTLLSELASELIRHADWIARGTDAVVIDGEVSEP